MKHEAPLKQPTDEDTLRAAFRAGPSRDSLFGGKASEKSDSEWVRKALIQREPTRVRLAYEGAQAVLSIGFRFFGVFLIFSSVLMWFWQWAPADPQVISMRWGVSVFMLLCGLALFMRNHEDAQPEVEFDLNEREMRVRQLDAKGRWEMQFAYPFDYLSAVRRFGDAIQVEDHKGNIVLRMRLRDQRSKDVLHALLSEEFTELAA